jgi:hypothetical protein
MLKYLDKIDSAMSADDPTDTNEEENDDEPTYRRYWKHIEFRERR